MSNPFKKEHVYLIYLHVCPEKIAISYTYSIILKYTYELKVNLAIKCLRNTKYCTYLNWWIQFFFLLLSIAKTSYTGRQL